MVQPRRACVRSARTDRSKITNLMEEKAAGPNVNNSRDTRRCAYLALSGILARSLFSVACVATAGLALFSCGTPGHATLVVSAPASVVANAPFSVTVTAMYQGKLDTVINGPIHFTTTDQAAHLPTLYVFTPADAGSHTFTGLMLVTPGNQTITVSDYDATPVAGSTNVIVSATAGSAN